MDPDKIAVRQIIRRRETIFRESATSALPIEGRQGGMWRRRRRHAAVTPLWSLIETGREIHRQNGDEDVVSPPRALTPRPHTCHQTPSFTLYSVGAGGAAFLSGAHDGANIDADGAALVPMAAILLIKTTFT